MEQSKQTTKQTICWNCARALLRIGVCCSWALHFQPVPGWSAVRSDLSYGIRGKERTNESYIVTKCPLFLSDADYQKQIKKQEEKKMDQVINTSDSTKMDRFDRNTRAAVNEIEIKEKLITLPAIKEFQSGSTYAVLLSRDGRLIELVEDKDGYTVSGTGRGGVGRAIRSDVLIEAMRIRGTVIPQSATLKKQDDGSWHATLTTKLGAGGVK